MKARIAELVAALRRAGIAVSVAEAMDAARAAALAGVERMVLREALAATLIKDEGDRPAFVAAFDATFPAKAAEAALGASRRRGRRSGATGGDAGAGDARAGAAAGSAAVAAGVTSAASESAPTTAPSRPAPAGSQPSRPWSSDARSKEPQGRSDDETAEAASARASDAASMRAADRRPSDRAAEAARTALAGQAAGDDAEGAGCDHRRVLRDRRLLRLPFRTMTPTDVEECAALARAIARRVTARVRRRLTPRQTGRLDFRRTIRAAVPRGGVPFERRYRGRRPGTPDLVALCDLSASTTIATEFFLALLAPAVSYFRQVRLFGFVDRLVEIEWVDGQIRPAAPIDLMARSDFGQVLKDLVPGHAAVLGADTVLLVLGDARNNRRPPRADLLAAARARVRRLLWLNPDPRERWNTGDSVMASYARHTDAVVACASLAELERALAAVAKL